jgi:ribonuclease D
LNYQIITSDSSLEDVCQAAAVHTTLALDTEFVRTRTYYPQLGLVQMFDGERLSLIDPLTITNWQPFIALLTCPDIVKYLHAGSEDLEVFLHSFGTMPVNMIDTQVLASFTGMPLSTGFAKLVEKYDGVVLDKSESRTDWLARPLSTRQCDYAAADVWYLLPLAGKLYQEAQRSGWLPAALDECQLMMQRRSDVTEPDEAWRDIGNAWQLRPRQLGCLKLLAAWRLREARKRDLAVNFVVREENLLSVARYLPGTLGELDGMGLNGSEIRYHGKTLLSLVEQAQAMPESELPEPISSLIDMPGYRKAFKAIKTVVQQVGEECGLSPELLASRRQINQLLNWHWQLKPGLTPELTNGWRANLLGESLRSLLTQY